MKDVKHKRGVRCSKAQNIGEALKKNPGEDENLHFNATLPSHFPPSQALVAVAGEQPRPRESNAAQRDIMHYRDARTGFNEQLGY